MQKDLGAPVSITFNSPFYTAAQYPVITQIMEQCMDHGFSSFIVADPGLIHFLFTRGLTQNMRLTVSGEIGQQNHPLIEILRSYNARRIIFHRDVQIADMAEIIRLDRQAHPAQPLDFEAFFLNELCQFTGAFCCSLHCDELSHICHMPYRLTPRFSDSVRPATAISANTEAFPRDISLGQSGCGFCALYKLQSACVTLLKIVSRGNYSEMTIRDLQATRKAINLAASAADEADYLSMLHAALFPNGCSGNCYYAESSGIRAFRQFH